MKRLLILSLTAALASSPAAAQVLLTENFNSENGGAGQLNYNAFTNWTVGGQVDLVNNGSFGVSCVGATGLCVDLDGSSGPGKILSKQAFAFSSGDVMKISFGISGNQRGAGLDEFFLGLVFGATTTTGAYSGTGGLAGYTGAGFTAQIQNFEAFISDNTPFSTWSFQFQAISSGTVAYQLGTTSADNAGPIADNIVVEKVVTNTVAPEPSSWAMLAFGLGGLTVAARRRVRKV